MIESLTKEDLRKHLEEYHDGIRALRCSNCNSITSPVYNVNLNTEIAELKNELEEAKKIIVQAGIFAKNFVKFQQYLNSREIQAADLLLFAATSFFKNDKMRSDLIKEKSI